MHINTNAQVFFISLNFIIKHLLLVSLSVLFLFVHLFLLWLKNILYISSPFHICTFYPCKPLCPRLYCIVMLLEVCSFLGQKHSKFTWKDVCHVTSSEQECIFPFFFIKTINSLCQYCHLTLINRKWNHNRRWSVTFYRPLSTESNSVMPQLWIKWRERNKWINIHSLILSYLKKSFTQCLWFFETLLECGWSSSSVHFLFGFIEIFFSWKCFISHSD